MSSNLLFNTIYLYIFGWWIDIGLILWFIWVLYIRHLVTPSACRILCENIQRMWERPVKELCLNSNVTPQAETLLKACEQHPAISLSIVYRSSHYSFVFGTLFLFFDKGIPNAHIHTCLCTRRETCLFLAPSHTCTHVHTVF